MSIWMLLAYSANVFIHAGVYIFFTTYPFKKDFRFSPPVSKLLILIYIVLITASDVLFAESSSPFAAYGILSVGIWFILSTVFCLLIIKGKPIKLIFTFLITLTLQFNQIVLARIIETQHFMPIILPDFPDLNYILYCFATLILVTPFLWYLFCRLLKQVEDTGINYTQWKFVFILPLSFYLYCIINFASREYENFHPDASYVFAFICINCFAYFSYIVILKMLLNLNKQLLAQQELNMMSKQHELEMVHYQQILQSTEHMKKLRHDWKQHLFVLKGYVEQDKKEELLEQLNDYLKQTTTEDHSVFCCNETINILLRYYASLANEHQIDFYTDIESFYNSILTDTELCIVLGNLLENALEACIDGHSKQFIRLSVRPFGLQLAVKIENTFSEPLRKKEGIFLSTKHKEEAIGIESVKSIVSKNSGIIKITHENNVFIVNVLLNL